MRFTCFDQVNQGPEVTNYLQHLRQFSIDAMSDPVLRLAPSPTGGFHAGNARTAVFNDLYARRYGGRLLLRVEDTDRDRFTRDSLATILEGLAWLGIAFDGDPVFQTGNAEAHRRAAESLLKQGRAYRCYCTPDALEAKRKQAISERRHVKYDGTCRDLSPEVRGEKERRGIPCVVRFNVREGETAWNDAIRGPSVWANGQIGDFVILRADGSATYQLAVVVDDHDMGVTLALRGADHLSNTPKQIMLFQALGWTIPDYAHTTLILGPDGKKLSKRHGDTTVLEYRERGLLPVALYNFLALLGWAPEEAGREVFEREALVEAFSIEGMLRKDAVFDERKLDWLQGEHIRGKSASELADAAAKVWIEAGWMDEAEAEDREAELARICALLRERIRTYGDFLAFGYFFKDPEAFEEKAKKRHWKADTPVRIEALVSRLEALERFTEGEVERVTRTLAGELGISPARLIHPARLALCGVGFGPGLFELMEVLGQETCIRRLHNGMALLGRETPVSAE